MQVPSPLPNLTSSEAMPTNSRACLRAQTRARSGKKRCRYGNELRPFPRLLVKITMVLPWWHPGITMV